LRTCPLPLGVESQPTPTRVWRCRVLMGSARGRGHRRRACAARRHQRWFGRSADRSAGRL